MTWPTAGEWLLIVLLLIFISFTGGFIDTWWEHRKREKERKEREKWQNKSGHGQP